MRYNQHKYVGDSIILGKNLILPNEPSELGDARGIIVFTKIERIERTDREFFKEISSYNKDLAALGLQRFRENVEHGKQKVEVRRSFGDINAWAGDHAKLHPPDGKARTFSKLKIHLQRVANTHDFSYVKLAMKNWDHFMPMSYRTWKSFHEVAIRLARKHAQIQPREAGFSQGKHGRARALFFDLEKSDLARALFLEAYGCHFLEDCFAAGHLRTPRLLFGMDPFDAWRSKGMHDEDNALRIKGRGSNGHEFCLIGEDDVRDDFTKPSNVKQDRDMKVLLGEVKETVAASVKQVFDVAFPGQGANEKVNIKGVSDRIPRVSISWCNLAKSRSRTHALEIWPFLPKTGGKPKPLYKIHANYDEKKKKFKDPILIKRSKSSGWRRISLSDVDAFTPGKKLAWWIPDHPNKKKIVP